MLPDAGRVTRDAADRRAQAEFDAFAARRRAHLEAEGEADALRALEDAAKMLPKRGTPKSSGGDS